MLGHSAVSQLPLSTSTVAVVEVIIDGKPLVWVLSHKNNEWCISEFKDTWVVKSRSNKWYKNN